MAAHMNSITDNKYIDYITNGLKIEKKSVKYVIVTFRLGIKIKIEFTSNEFVITRIKKYIKNMSSLCAK